jgi:L-amino acid N-acyltransferase YncA
MESVQLRLATEGDLEAIRAIYNHYVATSTCTYALEPETAEERRAWFAALSPRHPVTVAEQGGAVRAWAALSPWKARAGYAHSVEASVYVHHEHHRKGLGRALLADLIDRARAIGHHALIGGASAEQRASIELQKALGFVPVAHFREVGHKFGQWLDVIYTQLLL